MIVFNVNCGPVISFFITLKCWLTFSAISIKTQAITAKL